MPRRKKRRGLTSEQARKAAKKSWKLHRPSLLRGIRNRFKSTKRGAKKIRKSIKGTKRPKGRPSQVRKFMTKPVKLPTTGKLAGKEVEEVEAYCVKCQHKRIMVGPKMTVFKTKHGRRVAMKGTCPKCGTKMFRFMQA